MTPKLPRLPKAAVSHGHYQHMYLGGLYTGDQMKAYARKAIEEALRAQARPEQPPVQQSRD